MLLKCCSLISYKKSPKYCRVLSISWRGLRISNLKTSSLTAFLICMARLYFFCFVFQYLYKYDSDQFLMFIVYEWYFAKWFRKYCYFQTFNCYRIPSYKVTVTQQSNISNEASSVSEIQIHVQIDINAERNAQKANHVVISWLIV